MHGPLFLVAAGSVAAIGALVVASAMPAGAATAVRAETMARTSTDPTTCTAVPVTPATDPETYTACPEDTPVTFTVTSTGTLQITVPTPTTPIDLGSGAAGSTATGGTALGDVIVADTRNVDPADWSVSVSSTNFTDTTTAADVIDAGFAAYHTEGVTATTGVQGNIHDVSPVALTTGGAPIVSESGDVGPNGASWDPQIVIAIPPGSVQGTYDGVITHSLS